MRDYKRKMDRYRLPKAKYTQLRAFCQTEDAEQYILDALQLEFGEAPDTLAMWIYRHVTRTDCTWAYMEAHQIPCSRDTFRYYRAKFYYCLDQAIKNGATKKSPRGGNLEP